MKGPKIYTLAPATEKMHHVQITVRHVKMTKIVEASQMKKERTGQIFFLLIGLYFIITFNERYTTSVTQNMTYSEFKQNLANKNINEVTITGDQVSGTFKNEVNGKERFKTTIVDTELAQELDKYDVKYGRVVENTFFSDMLMLLLPTLLFIGIWLFIIRKAMSKTMGGGGGPGGSFMGLGKSKAKVFVEDESKVTFKDVAGADEALEELHEVIDFMKNIEKVRTLGGKMPKGVLLVGPPGTGKTLIAKAVAGEAGVPFFSTNGAEFVEMFVGVGAARVRDMFEEAKKRAPCIIFIDELDALGRARHGASMGGNDEKDQTLNQLLVEMDGFDTKAGIIILAATNRPEVLDPALLRSGRFDRQVLIDRPDRQGRKQILAIHVKKVTLDKDVDLDKIAGITPGFSGADLANLVNEAALIATRKDSNAINMEHFTNAMERMMAGLEKKNRLLNAFEREVVAYHEMGHALVGSLLNTGDSIHKVSIIPRGIGSLGYTIQRPTEDRFLLTQDELKKKMSVLLAGRAAESLIFSHLSTGASDDLVKATNIAREMVLRYGMSDELGYVTYDDSQPTMLGGAQLPKANNFSEETSRSIDRIVKELVMEAYQTSHNILLSKRDVLEEAAKLLLEKETLSEAELMKFFKKMTWDIRRENESSDSSWI